MAIQSAFYFTDGTTRTFPSTKHIASSANVAVWMKRVVDDVWELTSYELWTLANNSIVFTVAPQSTVYSQIELRIADDADELTEGPSNIALVAGSIVAVDTVATNINAINTVSTNITAVQNTSANTTNINTVATNAASVQTVALNIVDINVTADNITDINIVASDLNELVSEINTVATDIANVNTVGLAITNVNTVATSIANVNTIATNIANVNTVAGISAGVTTVATNNANVTTVATNIVGLNSVVANLTEVLLADDNAAIATTKASEAGASAISAQLTAWIAEAESMTAEAYATTPLNTLVSEYTSNGDGTFTATPTTKYSALHWAATIDDANLVHKTGDETVAGTKTFSSPIELSNSGFNATLQSGTLSGDVVHTLPKVSDTLAGISNIVGKNLLINANGLVNQRAYVSGTATTTANQYTVDRWRVVTLGQNLTFSTTAGVTTFTAPAGGVEQVIENVNVLGGSYVLTIGGTATALVAESADNVAYTTVTPASGVYTITGGKYVKVTFSGGTFSLPQFERGLVATPFENRHYGLELSLCQRYYEIGTALTRFQLFTSVAANGNSIGFKVMKRIAATCTPTNISYANCAGLVLSATVDRFIPSCSSITGNVNSSVSFDWTASAEL